MSKIDITKPRWSQDTYWGRAKHFAVATNPLNLLASNQQLEEAKQVVETFKKTKVMPPGYDEEKLWRAKYLYESAFHPDTGEKLILIGRMSAQMPCNTIFCAGMITFYKTTAQTVFWQWANQTFNAVVNYSNRSGDADIPMSTVIGSYFCACGGALGTALYLNSRVKHISNPLFARLVPFAAVCGANCINIPFMRSNEIRFGTPVYTKTGLRLGDSSVAARYSVILVIISRVIMSFPTLSFVPMVTNYGIKKGWFNKNPRIIAPFQTVLVGLCALCATPLACAIFSQQAELPIDAIESNIRDLAKAKGATSVVFNKGL